MKNANHNPDEWKEIVENLIDIIVRESSIKIVASEIDVDPTTIGCLINFQRRPSWFTEQKVRRWVRERRADIQVAKGSGL